MPTCRFCDENVPAGHKNCPSCGAEMPADEKTSAGSDLETSLLALIDKGEPLEAIKRYRSATGAGLAEAKEAIDSLAASRSLPAGSSPTSGGKDIAFETELLNLISKGNKIQAVKLYRERKGVGLKEAKDAVEGLAARHGVASKGSGCLSIVLIAVAVIATLAAV